jgi:hypothetical protein
MNDQVCLITGASSGIGAEVARKMAREGKKTILVARRQDRLEKIRQEIHEEGGSAEIYQADLGEDSERERLYARIKDNFGRVDILVNNAGFGWYGYYCEMPWKLAEQMIQVNVNAAVHLTRLFLPQMRERGSGHIINIGSIAGGFPNQGIAIYSASKSFLDAFTSGLHRELNGSGVKVSVVRAGPVQTEFFDQAALHNARGRIPAERFAVPPRLVAERVYDLLHHPRKVIYIPRLLAVTPYIELLFGRLIDRLGPLLLKRARSL